ncbi:MAG TPA: TetR/AcrR family transcriptional regulator [Acidimicrobiia bacterium]|jgi:AcrR family transcriptional regulator|nr:TetR/AcrR family transcriptional regulator [Acidimicrobiia bacterium]
MPRIRAETIAEHKEMTRRQVLEAAQELIAEVGSAEISFGEIASAVGIGRTTLYEYFADRDDVIASLVEEELPGVVEGLLAGLSAEMDPAQQLAEVAERTVRFVATDPVLGLILHREVGRLTAEAQRRIRDAHTDLITGVASIYARGVEKGSLHPMPVDLAGRFIQDTVMSAARAVISAADPDSRLPEIVAGMRRFLLHGLAGNR